MLRFKMRDGRLIEEEEELSEILRSYQPLIDELDTEGVNCRLIEIDDGIGASGPAIMGVVAIGASVFFGIPELYKRIGDAVKGWEKIFNDVDRAIKKLAGKDRKVYGYSEEYALLYVLNLLSEKVAVESLVLESVVVVHGKGRISEGATFETSSLSQYFFVLRDGREFVYSIAINSKLEIQNMGRYHLDPMHEK